MLEDCTPLRKATTYYNFRPHYAGRIWMRTEVSLWKRIKCFPSAIHRRNLKTQQSPVIMDSCLRKPQVEKSHDYRNSIVVENLPSQNVFRPHGNEKPSFWNSSAGMENVYGKLHFRDGLDGRANRKSCCNIRSMITSIFFFFFHLMGMYFF